MDFWFVISDLRRPITYQPSPQKCCRTNSSPRNHFQKLLRSFFTQFRAPFGFLLALAHTKLVTLHFLVSPFGIHTLKTALTGERKSTVWFRQQIGKKSHTLPIDWKRPRELAQHRSERRIFFCFGQTHGEIPPPKNVFFYDSGQTRRRKHGRVWVSS